MLERFIDSIQLVLTPLTVENISAYGLETANIVQHRNLCRMFTRIAQNQYDNIPREVC